MDLGLEGKVAVVTGASRGIGRSIAVAFAQEGVRLALCARNATALDATVKHLREKFDADVLACVADVGREGEIESVIDATVAKWGRLDILINNAGGPAPGTFDVFSDGEWTTAFELSLLSVVRAVRTATPFLKTSDGGRIVNILSTSVKQPLDGMILSNSLRAAVAGLAKTLTRELGAFGITVNNVCPAHVMTGRLREIAAYRAANGQQVDPKAAVEAIPLRRLGAPAEVADLVVFLASNRAAYISGATIPVDGGSTNVL